MLDISDRINQLETRIKELKEENKKLKISMKMDQQKFNSYIIQLQQLYKNKIQHLCIKGIDQAQQNIKMWNDTIKSSTTENQEGSTV